MARFGTTDSESVFSLPAKKVNIMTSSNGNIFRVTGILCGKFTGLMWIPRTKAGNVFFDLRLNEHLSKKSWGWWFETPSHPLWRHSNEFSTICCTSYWIVSSLVLCCLSCVVSAGPFPHLQLTELILQWRHNDGDGVSNHRRLDGLFNRLFGRRSKKISNLRVTGRCEGNSPVTGNFSPKGPVTRKIFPFDEVIMTEARRRYRYGSILARKWLVVWRHHTLAILASSQWETVVLIWEQFNRTCPRIELVNVLNIVKIIDDEASFVKIMAWHPMWHRITRINDGQVF